MNTKFERTSRRGRLAKMLWGLATTTLLLASVNYALDHREESVAYAMRFAREMSSQLADEFIGLYVNKLTLNFGDRGREAVRVFLHETHQAGLTPDAESSEPSASNSRLGAVWRAWPVWVVADSRGESGMESAPSSFEEGGLDGAASS